MNANVDFREIAHSGRSVTIARSIVDGRPRYSQTWQHCRPSFAAIFAVWALPQGIPVVASELGGIGQSVAGPPFPGCFQVFIGSDSEGKFGRQCHACRGYWRGQINSSFCPYCRYRGDIVSFLTTAQASYIAEYCAKFSEFMGTTGEGCCVIDMDAVADAAGTNLARPEFYYAEQSQQNQFTCDPCGSFNDILGRYGFCSVCGTRNDLQELVEKIIPALRKRVNDDHDFDGASKDAVGVFDSLAGSYVRHLVRFNACVLVPDVSTLSGHVKNPHPSRFAKMGHPKGPIQKLNYQPQEPHFQDRNAASYVVRDFDMPLETVIRDS